MQWWECDCVCVRMYEYTTIIFNQPCSLNQCTSWHLERRGSTVNGTFVEVEIRTWDTCECAYFSVRKCPIQTHDGANAKFSTYLEETDDSVIQ